MSGILRLESLTKGNTLKQGDKTPLKYRLFDADGEKLNIAGKSAVVRLMYPDYLRAGYESEPLTVSSDNTVTFSIDKIIQPVLYYLEITVDGKYIFPSRNDESKFNIDKSSQGSDAAVIEIIGKDVLVRDIKNMVDSEIEPVVNDMIVSNQKVIENEKIVKDVQILSEQLEMRQNQVEQFNNQVITEMTDRDVISAPEILGARGGFDTLGERLDDTTAQLAQIALNTNNFDTYQDAVNTAQNTSGVLMFPTGEHYLNNILIDPTKPLTVLGSGIENTKIKSEKTAFIIEQDDHASLSNALVISDIPYGSKVLNVDNTAGIKKGQLVFVRSTQDMEETAVSSKKQYTSFVDDVYTNQIVLTDKAPQTFDEGYEIEVLTFDHSPIVFSDLTVESKRNIGATTQTNCFYLKNVAGFTLNNVLMKDRDESKERNPAFDGSAPLLNGVAALQSKKIRINDVQLFHLVYGLLFYDGTSDVVITNPYTYYCRHTNNFAKGSYDLKIQGGKAYACYAGYDAHDTTIDVELYDCFSTGASIPTKLRARKKVVSNSTFEDGLWATINKSVLDAIPYETNEGSTFGVWLYNTNITDPDNRRTFLDGHTTIAVGGYWENVTTSTSSGSIRKILIVENLIYRGENNINNTEIAVFTNAETNTIRNCHAIGYTHGVASTDAESNNKIFFYHTNPLDSKVTFEGNLIDGFRSGYFMGSIWNYYNVNINNNKIINSGEAVRCVPSSMSFVGSMENNVFEGNYKDFDKARLFKSDTATNALPRGLEISNINAVPQTKTGVAKIFIHSVDNKLKIQFEDGTIKTIVVE